MASLGSTSFVSPSDNSGDFTVSVNVDTETGIITVGVTFADGDALVSADSTLEKALTKLNKVKTLLTDKEKTAAAGTIQKIIDRVTTTAKGYEKYAKPVPKAPDPVAQTPGVIAPASATPSTASLGAIAGAGVSLAGAQQAISNGVSNAVTGAASSAVNSVTGKLGGALGGIVDKAKSFLKIGGNASKAGAVIKPPLPTGMVPNPMHKFASWTYVASLWWLDVDDMNKMSGSDVGPGASYKLSNKSFVIAEDSGAYPKQRLPTQNGLDYVIQNIEFESVVGLNSKSKSSNMVMGNMMIVEPLGMTLLDTLVKYSRKPDGTFQSWTQQPYMIQIEFVGYDDTGTPVPSTETSIYKKRFPINIRGFGIESSKTGSEYKVEFTALNHVTHDNMHSSVPKNFTINAATVGEFFDKDKAESFTSQLNKFWLTEQVDKKTVEYADSIVFNIDPKIAESKIIYPGQMSLSQSNPNSSNIDMSKGNFSIPAGTKIQEVINKVLIQSEYLTKQLIDPTNMSKDQLAEAQKKFFSTYKTTVNVKYTGAQSTGTKKDGAFDNIRNDYAKEFTYNIGQFPIYNASHPAAPQASDSTPYTTKKYSYTYTGQNIDVLDFKLKLDSTFFTYVNTYTSEVAASQPTQNTAAADDSTDNPQTPPTLQWMGKNNVLPGANKTATLTPQRTKNIVNDQRDNTGMNIISNPKAQVAANLMRTIYSSSLDSAMQQLDLNIVGDPTLLKQDDWLYSPDPSATGSSYNSITDQVAFAAKFGHIKMDNGELVVTVVMNNPVDYDIDGANQGLMSPKIGTVPNLFSGQYKVVKIKNTFDRGTFTQTLNMVRLTNDLIAKNVADSGNSARADAAGSKYKSVTNAVATGKAVATNLRPTMQNDSRRLDR